MQDVTFNVLGWAEDSVLFRGISDALAHTATRDFVFAVSVQAHGKYPNEVQEGTLTNIEIRASETELPEDSVLELEYLVNQIHEVDRFIGQLVDYYADYNEPVIIVLYGDHIPNLDSNILDILVDDLHKVEYVIWSNYYSLSAEKELEAFRLSAHLFDMLGLSGGYVNTYNKLFSEDADYPSGLQYLGYYMLEDETFEIEPTDMIMGVKPIFITSVTQSPITDNENSVDITVIGENFTQYSYIVVDGKVYDTEFVDSNTLVVSDTNRLKEGNTISVAQIGIDTEILSLTAPFAISGNRSGRTGPMENDLFC